MASTPAFAATPRVGMGLISTANTNRDGTGTLVTIFTAGANGSKIERIRVKAIETTVASLVRIFIHDGSNARLYDEIDVAALTVSQTVKGAEGELDLSTPGKALLLPAGYSLRAAPHDAKQHIVMAFGGDY
jgi:hypothetical protein